MCVYRVCVSMLVLQVSIQDFQNLFSYSRVCTRFNVGSTVDTALLRRRLWVLLWADIRASMSSSTSSSENSCRRQGSGSNQKRRGDIWEAGQGVSAWVDAASFHKFNRTESGQRVVICLLAFQTQNHNAIGFTVDLCEHEWMSRSGDKSCVSAPLNANEQSETKQAYTDHQILHLFSAYSRLDACHAL